MDEDPSNDANYENYKYLKAFICKENSNFEVHTIVKIRIKESTFNKWMEDAEQFAAIMEPVHKILIQHNRLADGYYLDDVQEIDEASYNSPNL